MKLRKQCKIYSLFTYTDNDEKFQFPLDKLMNQIDGDYHPDIKTVKFQLLKKYGSDSKTHLTDASININRQSTRYSTQYPSTYCFFFVEINENIIPDNLRALTETVMILNKKRRHIGKCKTKFVALSHSIISDMRWKSFLSHMKIGFTTLMYNEYGSRKLNLCFVIPGILFLLHRSCTFRSVSNHMPMVGKIMYNFFLELKYLLGDEGYTLSRSRWKLRNNVQLRNFKIPSDVGSAAI
ncbi:hypothetical protein PR048_008267 [Dryococelus australis]|uniref:Uncharacterized protein n=1 Tax=Dryococelus australis TaxID=614101 RepID=A0ABQ9HXJ2_9NEOP|nr:hypothetical protein PR048_008267 [Dryococelus australis]